VDVWDSTSNVTTNHCGLDNLTGGAAGGVCFESLPLRTGFDTSLISRSIDLSAAARPVLRFLVHFQRDDELFEVYTSTDGGVTWDRATDLPNEFYPQASLFLDRERGWVVGLNGNALYTADAGNNWAVQGTGSDISLFGVAVQGERVFAVGDHGTVWFRDANEWRTLAHDKPALSYLRAVHPLDDGALLVAGGGGALFRLPAAEAVRD